MGFLALAWLVEQRPRLAHSPTATADRCRRRRHTTAPACQRGLAAAGTEGGAQTTTGPGLTSPGIKSEAEVNQMPDRLYQGAEAGS